MLDIGTDSRTKKELLIEPEGSSSERPTEPFVESRVSVSTQERPRSIRGGLDLSAQKKKGSRKRESNRMVSTSEPSERRVKDDVDGLLSEVVKTKDKKNRGPTGKEMYQISTDKTTEKRQLVTTENSSLPTDEPSTNTPTADITETKPRKKNNPKTKKRKRITGISWCDPTHAQCDPSESTTYEEDVRYYLTKCQDAGVYIPKEITDALERPVLTGSDLGTIYAFNKIVKSMKPDVTILKSRKKKAIPAAPQTI